MVLNISYQYRCIASLQCFLKKQGKLLSLLCLGLHLRKCWAIFSPIVHTFQWNRHLNFEGSQNWNGETSCIGVIKVYIHVQCIFKEEEIQVTCCAALNKSREKCGRAPTKYIKQKMFVGVRYQIVTKLCPLLARCIGSKRFMWICQPTTLPYLHILLIYLLGTWRELLNASVL